MGNESRSDVKNKRRRRKRRVFPAVLGVIFVAVATVAGVTTAFHFLAGGLKDGSNLLPAAIFDDAETGEGAERLNFLLIGTDGSNMRTDTILMVSLDFVDKKINLVSIPRDTRVLVNGRYHKINACAVIGGDELLINTVRDITGAPIHYYVRVSFTGFRNIIDILGGVDYYVPMDMHYSDPYQNLYIDLKEGQQHLDGDKAEQLVRFRRYPEADIQRTRVQKDFLKELLKQKLTPENFLRAPALYSDIAENVTTNFTVGDLMKHLDIIKLFQNAGDDTITAYEMPGSARMINGASYWIHDVDATLKLFKDNFGGSGTSQAKTTYSAAEQNALSSSERVTAEEAADSISESDATDEGLPADDLDMLLEGEDGPGEDSEDGDASDSADTDADDENGSSDTHSGDTHSGDTHSGDTHSGDTHSGDTHSGDTHSGDTHSGDSGDGSSGDSSSGSGGSDGGDDSHGGSDDGTTPPPADGGGSDSSGEERDISTPPEWLR
ncbi:MAG: LCP family protein [Clostridia bacterium]|nr:LCP family protein [Clostridia bacterium]